MAVNCTPMYTMSIYKEHFEFLDNIMYDLLDTFLPFKGSKVNSSDNQCITDKFRPLIKSRQEAILRAELSTYRQFRKQINRKLRKINPAQSIYI